MVRGIWHEDKQTPRPHVGPKKALPPELLRGAKGMCLDYVRS